MESLKKASCELNFTLPTVRQGIRSSDMAGMPVFSREGALSLSLAPYKHEFKPLTYKDRDSDETPKLSDSNTDTRTNP